MLAYGTEIFQEFKTTVNHCKLQREESQEVLLKAINGDCVASFGNAFPVLGKIVALWPKAKETEMSEWLAVLNEAAAACGAIIKGCSK